MLTWRVSVFKPNFFGPLRKVTTLAVYFLGLLSIFFFLLYILHAMPMTPGFTLVE